LGLRVAVYASILKSQVSRKADHGIMIIARFLDMKDCWPRARLSGRDTYSAKFGGHPARKRSEPWWRDDVLANRKTFQFPLSFLMGDDEFRPFVGEVGGARSQLVPH
jgi:hypothetical protein